MDEALKQRIIDPPSGKDDRAPEVIVNRAIAVLNAMSVNLAIEAVNNCDHANAITADAIEFAVTNKDVFLEQMRPDLDDADSRALDQLHRAIVCGDISEALDLLREIAPSHSFLTVRAESQLAIGRGEKVLI